MSALFRIGEGLQERVIFDVERDVVRFDQGLVGASVAFPFEVRDHAVSIVHGKGEVAVRIDGALVATAVSTGGQATAFQLAVADNGSCQSFRDVSVPVA